MSGPPAGSGEIDHRFTESHGDLSCSRLLHTQSDLKNAEGCAFRASGLWNPSFNMAESCHQNRLVKSRQGPGQQWVRGFFELSRKECRKYVSFSPEPPGREEGPWNLPWYFFFFFCS